MAEPDRTHLPIRRPSFAGVANRTLDGSKPDWNLIGHPTPPAGAPNVLLVLIDDAGFGNPSTFGGPIQTPNYTRMAEQGIRYNRFHVTALCSPTRAALLTGRNNHFVGFGSVGEFAGGFPGYSASLPRDCAPLPRILRDNGYSTSAYGKWHLTPDGQQGPAGPFDRWPNGWGFDYFYGFLAGDSGQWDPCLIENQKVIGTPEGFYDEENPYYFPDAMADRAIEWLHGVRAQDADKPFFIYFSTGCSHAPHHVAEEWANEVQGEVRPGVGQAPRGDLRASEGAGGRPGRCGAHTARRRVPCVGRRARQAQAVLLPADGGVRRILRERRPQRRSPDRRDRGARRARQHGRRVDLGRQRRQHGGHGHRFLQRDDDAERHPADGRDAAAAVRAIRGHGEVGSADHGPPLRRGVGVGRERPVQVGQAGRLSPRRHAQPDGHPVAGARHGHRRVALAVRPRDRRRADDPRRGRDPAAEHGRRHRPGADARHVLRRVARGCRRSRAPDPAVLRDHRQPRHVQGRLVARHRRRRGSRGSSRPMR